MFLPVWCGENVGLSTHLINTQRPGDLPEAPRLRSSSDSLCHLSQGRDWPTDPPVSLVEVRFLEGGQVSAGLANNECRSHGGCTFVMTNPKATAGGVTCSFHGLWDGTVGDPLGRVKAAPAIPLKTRRGNFFLGVL